MPTTSLDVPTPRRTDLEQDSITVTTTNADLSPIYASLTTNASLIGDNSNDISALQSDTSAIQGSVTQIVSDLASNVLSISSLSGDVVAINGSLATITNSLTSHQSSIQTLSTDMASAQFSVGTLSTGVLSLSTENAAQQVSLGTLSTSVSTLNSRLNTLSYSDLNGTIPNSDVGQKALTADKMYYDTTGKTVVGTTSYPSDSIGFELDWQNSNWWDIISSAYTAVSMATAFNTLMGDPAQITSIASLVAKDVEQDGRLFDLDAPVSGRVTINENDISTLSSSVGTLETKTTGLSRSGTTSQISGDLSITGQLLNTAYENLEDQVGLLQAKTQDFSFDDLTDITTFDNNIKILGSITNTDFQTLQSKTTDLTYATNTTTIANDLSVAGSISNTGIQDLEQKTTAISYDSTLLKTTIANDVVISGSITNTGIQNLETATRYITSPTTNQTSFTGVVSMGEASADSMVIDGTAFATIKNRTNDQTYLSGTTTFANKLVAGTISATNWENAPSPSSIQNISSSGANQTTISGTLTTDQVNGGTLSSSSGILKLNAARPGESGARGIYFRDGFTNYNCSILTYNHGSGTFPDGISINAFDGISFCSGDNSRNEVGRFNSSGFYVNGLISNGTYAPGQGYMSGRTACFGDIALNYGGATNGWQSNGRTAGLMLECLDTTEIAVHDAGTRVASLMYYSGNNLTIGRSMNSTWGALDGLYSSASYFSHLGGSKIVVQGGVNGGNTRGLWLWTGTDSNWGIYMTDAGAGKSMSNGTAVAGSGFSAHAIRFRVYGGGTSWGFIWEDSSERLLASLRASDGYFYTKGYIASAYDINQASYFGRAAVGYCGHNDYASFAHLDTNNTTGYALLQNYDGTTFLNCAATKKIYIREANQDIASFSIEANQFGTAAGTLNIYNIWVAGFSSYVRISNTSGWGFLSASTSLRKYKKDIEDTDTDFIKGVIDNLRPRFYRYDVESGVRIPEAKTRWSQIGLIAEEAVEADPRLGTYEEDGETLNGVDYERVAVYLLAHIKQTLEPKIADLEAKIDAITRRLDGEIQATA